ncbi:spore germination protein Q [Gracilibacillus ureilyticus]|uniref:Spore germination protein Q n=1 Tax=Gracilibacillus ureilyticus TaxID=531814 RepID=A0A1H9SVE0_9BACI|nr:spore coat protein GerQ [Gracilibacillus ureilyticus]SER88891.1 spore germination protein Q [Gracilibacillus ureilyticus]
MSQDSNQSRNQQGYNPQSYYGMQGGYQQPYYPYQQQFPTQAQAQAQLQPQMQTQPNISDIPGMLPVEQSYIENILRLNKGKRATVYMTFENNERWNAKVFKGIIEAAGRDHIVLSDPETNKRYLLLMVYLDYITFDEEIEYDYPFNQQQQLATFSPR